jgi:hypothetical protein
MNSSRPGDIGTPSSYEREYPELLELQPLEPDDREEPDEEEEDLELPEDLEPL